MPTNRSGRPQQTFRKLAAEYQDQAENTTSVTVVMDLLFFLEDLQVMRDIAYPFSEEDYLESLKTKLASRRASPSPRGSDEGHQ